MKEIYDIVYVYYILYIIQNYSLDTRISKLIQIETYIQLCTSVGLWNVKYTYLPIVYIS